MNPMTGYAPNPMLSNPRSQIAALMPAHPPMGANPVPTSSPFPAPTAPPTVVPMPGAAAPLARPHPVTRPLMNAPRSLMR